MGVPLKNLVKNKASPERIPYFFTLPHKKSSIFTHGLSTIIGENLYANLSIIHNRKFDLIS